MLDVVSDYKTTEISHYFSVVMSFTILARHLFKRIVFTSTCLLLCECTMLNACTPVALSYDILENECYLKKSWESTERLTPSIEWHARRSSVTHVSVSILRSSSELLFAVTPSVSLTALHAFLTDVVNVITN